MKNSTKPAAAPITGGTLQRNGVSLVPVHASADGSAAFSYDVVTFSPGQASPKPLVTITDDSKEPDDAAEPRGDDGDLPEFISLAGIEGNVDGESVEQEEDGGGEDDEEDLELGDEAPTYRHEQPLPSTMPDPILSDVPWRSSLKGIASPMLRLHQEMVEFVRFLTPSSEEQLLRQAAISRIEEIVKRIWPTANLQVFGSFATGLYLPTSDVDVVILNSGCGDVALGLKALASALSRQGLGNSFQIILKARVPIAKFREARSGYNFDVSFDVSNGPEAASTIRALMDNFSAMRPLTLVLKLFLQQRELNEVYSGGLGSYALSVMIASFLQAHPSRFTKPGLEKNLGVLLVDFFRLYGRSLQHTSVGVSCRKDAGSYFKKEAKGFYVEERPYLLAIEDPNDETNDLGRNSYNIMRVRVAFDHAYCQLIAPSALDESLLKRILRLDSVLFSRQPPKNEPTMAAIQNEVHNVVQEPQRAVSVTSKGSRKTRKREKQKRSRRERSLSDDERDLEKPKRKNNVYSKRKSA